MNFLDFLKDDRKNSGTYEGWALVSNHGGNTFINVNNVPQHLKYEISNFMNDYFNAGKKPIQIKYDKNCNCTYCKRYKRKK